MRAVLVLLFVLLLPGAALAHGEDAHSRAKPSEPPAAAPWRPADHAISPACPTPVHACGCGNLPLCDATAKPAAPLPEAAAPVPTVRLYDEPVAKAAALSASPERSLHRPRAPPVSFLT